MMLRRASIAAVVSLVVLTGCGAAEKVSPRAAVRAAAEETANQKEGSFKLTLVGSDDDLNALFNEGAPLTDEDRQGLDLLRNGHIAFSTGDDKFSLDVKVGDLDHAFELRYVDQKVYARADVAGLVRLFGGSPGDVNQTLQGLASQEGFGFLAAAAEGRWITADFSAMSGLAESLEKQFGGADGSIPVPTTDPAAMQSQFEALKDAFGKALSEDVSVKEVEGDSVGDHYVATLGSLRTFYSKLRPVLEQQIGGQLPVGGLPPASTVPDQPASVDVWIKSGRVTRLELDLTQFAPASPAAGGGRVALRLDIAREAEAVTAPSDAVSVDLAGLIQKFMSQFGAMLQGAGGGLSQYD